MIKRFLNWVLTFELLLLLSTFGLGTVEPASAKTEALISETELLFLELINDYRNSSPICFNDEGRPVNWTFGNNSLKISRRLTLAADFHNEWQVGLHDVAHEFDGGPNLCQRLINGGYGVACVYGKDSVFPVDAQGQPLWYAENVAGQFDPYRVLVGFAQSPSHNRAMLSCNAEIIGISEMNRFWVTDFGVAAYVEDDPNNISVEMEAAAEADSEEQLFLKLINDYRNAAPQCWNNGWFTWPLDEPRLHWSDALSVAAANHNQVMISQNCFSHVCPGEAGVAERVQAVGYTGWRFLSENIAGGMATAAQAFDAWKESDGHDKNMLACRARAIGIDRSFGEGTDFGWYWTTDFGDVIDTPKEPDPLPDPDPVVVPPDKKIVRGPSGCFPQDANANNQVDDFEALHVIWMWITSTPICAVE